MQHSETRAKKHLLKPFPHKFQRLSNLSTRDEDQQEWWRRKRVEGFTVVDHDWTNRNWVFTGTGAYQKAMTI